MVTDELRATNGHSHGRAVSDHPTITLSSGITIGLRRQSGDVMPKARAAAERELEGEKPPIPTQSMETEPGVWRDIPNEQDPAYQEALRGWEFKVASASAEKLFLIMRRFALVFEVDQDRLKELRTIYGELGMEIEADDRVAYLSHIIAPTQEDQGRLFEEVYGRGLPQEAQVALHRRMFPGDLEGHAA